MANFNASIIPFDAQGAFGPALTLIYKSKDLTESEIATIAHIIEKNFTAMAAKAKDDKMGIFVPTGKDELCRFIVLRNSQKRPVLATEMISQQFFQSMQNHRVNEASHQKMMKDIVPAMLNVAKPHFPDLDSSDKSLIEWTSRFVECYMTEGQISSYVVVSEAFMKERMRVAEFVSTLVKEQKLSENDFGFVIHLLKQMKFPLTSSDLVWNIMSYLMQHPNHHDVALELVMAYDSFLRNSKDLDPRLAANDIVGKTYLMRLLIQNPNCKVVLEAVKAYASLFMMSQDPQRAANDVVGKLHLLQAKLFPKVTTS